MKVKNALLALGLTLTLGIGVGVGLAAKQNMKETKAASAGDTLSFYCDVTNASWWKNDGAELLLQTWNGTADVRYPGEWLSSTLFEVKDVDTTGWTGFKFVRHVGSNYYNFATWSTDFDNRVFTHSGTNDNGTWADSVPPTYSLTLSVEFTSVVPDYADIFIPGAFNGWAEDNTTAKMTRVSDTVFTYPLTNVFADTYQYQIVACYAGAAKMDWNHKIDADPTTVTIAASDDGTTKALANRTYDFATKMPQETAPEGAHVKLIFGSAVPTTVDIIYVGGLTQWGHTTAALNAGKMTANENRTIFTWNLPDDTYTGTYEYKIVAMSKYTPATEANYDHIVYGNSSSNEQLVVDKTTTEYALTANDYDLSYIGAYAFAEGFIDAMDDICGTTKAEWEIDHTGTALSNTWGNWKTIFESLTEGAKTAFGENNNSTIDQARKLYVHCVARYKLSTWTDAPDAAPRVTFAMNNEDTMIYVIIIAFAAISAVGVFFAIKRRKHISK